MEIIESLTVKKLNALLSSFMQAEDAFNQMKGVGDDQMQSLLNAQEGLALTYMRTLSEAVRNGRGDVSEQTEHTLAIYHTVATMALGDVKVTVEHDGDIIIRPVIKKTFEEMVKEKDEGITASLLRKPGGLVEQFEQEYQKWKEQGPAGMKPMKYVGIGNTIYKEEGHTPCIEIVYPDEENIEENALLLSSVMTHADEILNLAGDDEQRHATEEKIHQEWMKEYGEGYRDHRTKVVVDRSLSGKAKVTFKVSFMH